LTEGCEPILLISISKLLYLAPELFHCSATNSLLQMCRVPATLHRDLGDGGVDLA
jgi:hypothetical protein